MSKRNILIVAGEPSGDLHASNLVKNLKSLDPDLNFFGLGGALSKKAGVDIVFDISALALVGVIEVLKNIFTIRRAYKTLIAKIDSSKPDLAILVDYPGFNLTLAKELKKRSIPIIYYISPQVWAWGRDRIKIIKRCVKKMIVLFKFEEELYKANGIDAEFFGHPLLDIVKATSPEDAVLKKYNLSKEKTTIALLPGSRSLEVRSFLKIMLSSAGMIAGKLKDAQFIIAKHPELPFALYENALNDFGPEIRVAEADTYNVLSVSDFAIVASGTATLETAIIGTPLVVIYKANLITYMAYKFVMTLPFLGLVNIIAGKEIAPELLQFDATPEKISQAVVEILQDENRLSAMRKDLSHVKSSLGAEGASLRAARSILTCLQ